MNSPTLTHNQVTFLGKPTDYWLELQKNVEENNDCPPRYADILIENHRIKSKLLMVERLLSELQTFVHSNPL